MTEGNQPENEFGANQSAEGSGVTPVPQGGDFQQEPAQQPQPPQVQQPQPSQVPYPAPGYGAPGQRAYPPQPQYPGPGQAAPSGMSPKLKKNLLRWGIVAAAVVVVVVGGAITLVTLGGAASSASTPVKDYLSLISEGKASDANKMVDPGVSGAKAILLSDKALTGATERISAVQVQGVESAGDRAAVSVSYQLGGHRTQTQVTLRRTGTQFLFFPVWTIDSALVADVSVDTGPLPQDLLVGDQVVPSGSDGYSELKAYPAIYPVSSAPSDKYFTAAKVELSVGGQTVADPPELKFEPSKALLAAVNAKIKTTLDQCAASTAAQPAGCPQAAYPLGDVPVTWKVDSYPQITIDNDGDIDSATDGSMSGSYTDPYLGPQTEQDDITPSGDIKITGDKLTIDLEFY